MALVQELQAFEKNMGEDFRLNHRLESACEKDTMRLCHEECIGATEFQPCGGKVLHCLTEKQINVTSRECKKEIDYYIKMEVRLPRSRRCRAPPVPVLCLFCTCATPVQHPCRCRALPVS